jgi:SAM-dependent methyltransferase
MQMTKNTKNNTVKYYDIIYSDWIGADLTESEIDLIRGYLPSKGNLLDVGCGSGRHAIPLHRAGYKVTCVEPLKEFVKVLSSKEPQLNVVMFSFKNFETPTKFDVIISMWNAFHQIALTSAEALEVLSKMKSLLKPKGTIILNLCPGEERDIDNYSFEHEIYENGFLYHLDWNVLEYTQETRTVESEEKITVYDDNNDIVDKQNTTIIQRYWREEEIIDLAKQLSLEVTIISPTGEGQDKYYLFHKKDGRS